MLFRSVHISKYGKYGYAKEKSNKVGEKTHEQRWMVLTVGDDVWGTVFRIQCAFLNMEGVAILNEE